MEPNTIYEDNPPRYLVTYQEIGPGDNKLHPVTKIIETEPSLWWRKKRRNLTHTSNIVILNTWYIGGGDA